MQVEPRFLRDQTAVNRRPYRTERAPTATPPKMCLFFPDKPPNEVKAKGARGQQQQAMLDLQANPYGFALGLKDAPCKVLTIDAAQILHTCHARCC